MRAGARDRFAGIERADSFIVDPHKWLFAPFDSCALIYREPAYGRAAHRQHAAYLDSLYADDAAFNPSDYGVHLTRRARGLPFWFSLAVHGTDAYAEAVERTLAVTREAADEIRARDELELVAEPELSVLVFRRLGWGPADYDALGGPPAPVRHRVRAPDDPRRRDRSPGSRSSTRGPRSRTSGRARRDDLNRAANRTLRHVSAPFKNPPRDDAPAMTTPPLKPVRAANVQQVLATQRDLHLRQRELVRASLTLCPGKPPRRRLARPRRMHSCPRSWP